MCWNKILGSILLFAAVSSFASASTATPKKVGPVSYYGALHTSGSKIIGAKNNQQVMLRGVSLFWADSTGIPYYNPTVISWVVDNLKIDVFRYAMGIEYYDSNGGTKNNIDDSFAYKKSPETHLSLIDKMVQTAIENDVYIIIDWHSYRAHLETTIANEFFKTISEKYKDVPNVIYEIYAEPVSGSGGDWTAIKSYANTICPAIRANTQNLIIVGTPNWSQHPEQGARDPVNSTNIAYSMHFYAATHSKNSYGGNVTSALNAGYPVFISDWGTTNADGDGEPNASATSEWTSFMDQNYISNCNSSLRQQTSEADGGGQKSAIFAGNKALTTAAALDAATLTNSGNIVKSYLTKNARSWADSLVKGKNKGSCAFRATSAKQTEDKISGVLKSGCTYSSSNEKIVSVYGSEIIINDYGFAILTGNDGSQSVVTITQVAGQSITNLENLTCSYSGTCSSDTKNGRTFDFDGDGVKDYLLTADDKTEEGSKFTLTALDSTTISVSKSMCTDRNCSNTQKDQKVWMLHFHGYGTGRIVASAPAVTGFRAMQDTFEISYAKGETLLSRFKNQKVALDFSSKTGLPDTSVFGVHVTYTYNGKQESPYLTKSGNGFVAGSQPAIIAVTASVPESDNYSAFEKTVTFIIGDSASAVNLDEYLAYIKLSDTTKQSDTTQVSPDTTKRSDTTQVSPDTTKQSDTTKVSPDSAKKNSTETIPSRHYPNIAKVRIDGKKLMFVTENAGVLKLDVYDAIGSHVKSHSGYYSAGSRTIDLNGLAQGTYVLVIRQGKQTMIAHWKNK